MAKDTTNISEQDFIDATRIVATVIAARFWHSTQGPPPIIVKPSGGDPAALRIREAANHIGVGRTKFLEMAKAGDLPKPKRVGGRPVWRVVDLDKYLAKQPGA